MKTLLALLFISSIASAECVLTCESAEDPEGQTVYWWGDASPGQCGELMICVEDIGTSGCEAAGDLGNTTEGQCLMLPEPPTPLHR